MKPHDVSIFATTTTAGRGQNMFKELLAIDPKLLTAFTGVFSRYEYALKSSGFANGGINKVDPDWDAFAQSVADKFDDLNETGFREAVIYLVTNPPRKQVLNAHGLGWKDSPPDSKLRASAQALLMVRRVRNNLFHGGKFWMPESPIRDRNEKLVKASLAVLLACLPLNPRVCMTFGPLPRDNEKRLSRLAA
ncbi:hypothetical protein L0Z42_11080 [Burkholderia multivorans]|uniref:hypothetical protein n=1 Tax=Burkholderia multivorans TaxID=87883 RepID=UPI0011B1DF85|nr:hypothetical protein [Burkholderia multivorans]MBU9318292.1 hypothetical protein [Burkholderia multivorans]MCL4625336.1 hypothetical protein [Burkholderia multivorans]MCO1371094.1 hypothetical protein [Burkholderia multivorans]MCO1387474.1 hypothetical protein [Burkholderia multivorans]MCO1457649.1 hypothetical protein [Burkholderia multivorans]